MKYDDRLSTIKQLPFDKEMVVIRNGGLELFVLRPSQLSSRFKNYDVKKNFQIWLHDGPRSFKPNHLSVMIDLYLRVRSRPDLKPLIAQVFDGVFYGEDPDELVKKLGVEKFEHFINPLSITANLSQLFIIEQAYGYHKESRYNPPTLFFQGWIRQIIDSEREIDNVIMSIAKGNTPNAKYTFADDKKHKKYASSVEPLWWLS